MVDNGERCIMVNKIPLKAYKSTDDAALHAKFAVLGPIILQTLFWSEEKARSTAGHSRNTIISCVKNIML